jgi:hypothetical protein
MVSFKGDHFPSVNLEVRSATRGGVLPPQAIGMDQLGYERNIHWGARYTANWQAHTRHSERYVCRGTAR